MMAYANGEKVEGRKRGGAEWFECALPRFDWWSCEFRVKPKQEKFDPKTLQPFDKVVIWSDGIWCCDFFSSPCGGTYLCVGCLAVKVMPYNDETKHLIGTSDEAPEYYRYWGD